MKHTSTLALITTAALITGCASAPPEWLAPQSQCNYIGCETGELAWYPSEDFGSQRQARRWYGFDWAESSSAHHPSSEEYKRLRSQEILRLRQMGLDPWGRPLND